MKQKGVTLPKNLINAKKLVIRGKKKTIRELSNIWIQKMQLYQYLQPQY